MTARTVLDSPGLYTVGWIAALPIERASATAMLDERHDEPNGFSQHPADVNSYTWGRMGKHNVVIASLAAGVYGTTSAATTASNMLSSLPDIRIGLLVGIGGGISRPEEGVDIRLGDIVVSQPDGSTGGVVQYDLVKAKSGKCERKDFLNMPPSVLLHALANLQSEHCIAGSRVPEILEEMWKSNPRMKKSTRVAPGFIHQGVNNDRLFRSSYNHIQGRDCRGCDQGEEVPREERDSTDPDIHYGIIASGNTLIKDASARDQLIGHIGEECLCVEMEAAGIMNHFPCLVIRGICDYADSHKNDRWQCYASATAAAFGKELLEYVPVKTLQETQKAAEILQSIDGKVDNIISITSNTNTGVRDVLHTLQREEDIKILDWLSKIPSQEKQRDVLRQHQEGTGKYFLDSPRFKGWADGKDRILWCIGSPGTGKSVLASLVVDTIEKGLASSKAGLAFLYCVYAERKNQTIYQLLGSVIRQLILQRPSIPDGILELYELHRGANTRPDVAELTRQLETIVSLFPKVYIVVDALDECDDTNKTRRTLLSQLRSLGSQVQLFFTSRPLEDILLDAVQFKVTAQEDDMRKYLRARLKDEHRLVKLCADNGGLEDEILDKIIARVDGMFLLARLHLQSIACKLRVGTLRKALETLPENFNDTYDDALRRIEKGQVKDHSELAMKMLMLLSYALRPLKLGEVQHALLTMEVKAHDTGIDRDDVYDKELLFTVCAGIITLEDETSTVRFVHHTAETYFETRRTELFTNAYIDLTTTCITYLSFPEFESGYCSTREELEQRTKVNQLYDYAANNWGHHARDAPTLTKEVVRFLESKGKMDASSQMLVSGWRHFDINLDFPRYMTGLHLAAYFGLSNAINKLSGYEDNPDPVDSYGRTPLMLAVQNGRDAVVKMLLDTGKVSPDLLSSDSRADLDGRTPLLHATARGYQAIAEMLLKTDKVDPNAKETSRSGRTPLLYAAERGDEAVVKLLLEKGADPDSKDSYQRTPLSYAAENGKENVVKLLVEAKCEIDRTDSPRWRELSNIPTEVYQGWSEAMLLDLQEIEKAAKVGPGWSALHWASMSGHAGVVRFLLEKGADIKLKDTWGGTALSMAVVRSRGEVVKALIENGVEISRSLGLSERITKWTVLHIAAARRDTDIMRILLKNGASTKAEDERGRAPLHMVALGVQNSPQYNLEQIGFEPPALGDGALAVQLLHEHGAEINAKDIGGKTALHWAARLGFVDIAQRLLELGADPKATDQRGCTTLHMAAMSGSSELVKSLIDRKVDVNAVDNEKGTALFYAAQEGRFAVAQILIENGAIVNAGYGEGWMPLHIAAGQGHKAVVQILIENKADLDAQGPPGYTALFMAAGDGEIEVVRLLVEHGASLELEDEDGRTALHAAARSKHREIFDLLVEKGANIYARDNYNLTPKSSWGKGFG